MMVHGEFLSLTSGAKCVNGGTVPPLKIQATTLPEQHKYTVYVYVLSVCVR